MTFRPLPIARALLLALATSAPAAAFDPEPCFDDLAQLTPEAARAGPRPKGALGIPWFEWLPAVMPYNRPTVLPMTFTVRITGGATSAQLTLSNGGSVVPLRDDGVAPDATAGDLVFSGSVPVQAFLDRNTPDRVHKPFIGSMQAFENGVPSGGTLNVFGFVMPPEAESIPVTTVSSTLRTTPWLVNLRDDAFANDFLHERVIGNAIALLGDRFEFAHVVWGPRMYVSNRFHGRVRNNVTGIGLNTFDTGASFGSAARLIGYSAFPNWSFYDMQGPGVLHETGHQWVNGLTGIFTDPRSGSHFPIGTVGNAVMGISLAGGPGGQLNCTFGGSSGAVTTAATPQARNYNELELYLMGLRASFGAGFLFTDQTAIFNTTQTPGWCNGQVLPLATTAFTQASVTTAFGARNPSFANSPKRFKVLTAVASSGRTLDDTELRYLSYMALRAQEPGTRAYSEGFVGTTGPNFNAATGGVGTLDFLHDRSFADGFESLQ